MGGKTDEEIQAERDRITIELKEKYGEDVEILDTNFNFPRKSALYYLAKSIEKLDEADMAYFMEDWYNYRGCRIENHCCLEYNIEREYEK